MHWPHLFISKFAFKKGFDRVGKEMICNRWCSSSTLERGNGGGHTVDHIFSKHLSAISFSLLSMLTSLLYIGGAHIFDVSLIISLNWVVNFITAYKKSIIKVTRKNQSHKINSSIDNLGFLEHIFKLPHLPHPWGPDPDQQPKRKIIHMQKETNYDIPCLRMAMGRIWSGFCQTRNA